MVERFLALVLVVLRRFLPGTPEILPQQRTRPRVTHVLDPARQRRHAAFAVRPRRHGGYDQQRGDSDDTEPQRRRTRAVTSETARHSAADRLKKMLRLALTKNSGSAGVPADSPL